MPTMELCTLLLGGFLEPTDRLHRQVQGAYVIAADSGIRHAHSLDLNVDLWVGDFDSTKAEWCTQYRNVERHFHPRNKDQTDGALALEKAVQKGAKKIIMAGGLGGASDHAFSHILQMLALAKRGVNLHITSGYEEAWPLIPGRTELEIPEQTRLSIIGIENLKGLSLSNVRWELEKKEVSLGSTLTLSNESLGPVSIELAGGYGAIFLTFHSTRPSPPANPVWLTQ